MEALLKSLRSSSKIEEQGRISAKFLKCVDLLSWVLTEQGKYRDAMDVCETSTRQWKRFVVKAIVAL
jgi:hypothetical protein